MGDVNRQAHASAWKPTVARAAGKMSTDTFFASPTMAAPTQTPLTEPRPKGAEASALIGKLIRHPVCGHRVR